MSYSKQTYNLNNNFSTMIKIFSIEGNIGSGKSTLVEILKKYYKDDNNFVFLQEPVSIWETIKDKKGESIISKFYGNTKKYAFSFQMMAYISRISLLKKAIRENPYKVIITERCVHTDRNIFAKMLYDEKQIEEVDYQIYLKWFDEFIQDIPLTGLIYVKASPLVCYNRVLKRNREGENIPLQYLENCHLYHEEWINNTNMNTLTLDANNDKEFTTNDYKQWLETIRKFIDYHRYHYRYSNPDFKQHTIIDLTSGC